MKTFRRWWAVGCVLALAGSLAAETTTPSLQTIPPSSTAPTVNEVGGRTLSQWMTDLRHKDPSTRAQAITNIPAFGERAAEAVPLLIDRCQDTDASPRAKAVITLKFVTVRPADVPKVVEALARRLTEDPQSIVRYEAAVALVRFADDAKPVVPALLRGVDDTGTWEIRHASIIALRRAAFDSKAGPDKRATVALMKALRDPVERVRLEATVSLGAMGRPADPQLLGALVSALQQQLAYRDKALSLWSHVSLMALDDKVSEQSLQAILKLIQSPERDIRLQVLLALGAMGAKAKAGVPAVIACLEDQESAVVAAACATLPRLGDPSGRVLDALIKVTQRKEQGLVWAGCAALGEIGGLNPDALAALIAVTQRKELDDQLVQGVSRIIETMRKPKK